MARPAARLVGTVGLPAVMLAFALAAGCRRAPESTPVDSGAAEPPGPPPLESSPLESETPADETCDGQPCAAPRECIRYFGIAGPSGPTFHACEIRCERGVQNDGCPEGTRCVIIADGPGEVCR